MQGASDSKMISVCRRCILFLQSKFSSEMGLLRCSVSQVDVRELRELLMKGPALSPPPTSDIYVVAEVLQLALRQLQPTVLNTAYDDIVSTDHGEIARLLGMKRLLFDLLIVDWSSASEGVRMIRSWLAKGAQEEAAELLPSLFDVLHRIAFVNEREADLRTLAYTISPSLCCHRKYTYMSLKHLNDLEKIRPAVAFMIKHSQRIFCDLGVVPVPTALPLTLSVMTPDNTEQAGERSPTLIRPNLTVIIPATEAVAPKPTVKATPRSMGRGHSTEEWTILQALVLGTAGEACGLDFSPAACLPAEETDRLRTYLAAIPPATRSSGLSPHNAAAPANSIRTPCASAGTSRSPCHGASPRWASNAISSPTAAIPRSPHSHPHPHSLPHTPHAAEARSPHGRTQPIQTHTRTRTRTTSGDADWQGIAEEEPSPPATEESTVPGRARDLEEAARTVQRVYRRYSSRCLLRKVLGAKRADLQGLQEEQEETPQTARSERTAEEEAYNVLMEEKNELQARLRWYDCEFERTWGRAPQQREKGAIGPLHRVYNQMRTKLCELRTAIFLPCT